MKEHARNLREEGMRGMFITLSLLFCFSGFAYAGEYLVKIEAGVARDLRVIQLVDDQALFIADERILEEIRREGIPHVILVSDPNLLYSVNFHH